MGYYPESALVPDFTVARLDAKWEQAGFVTFVIETLASTHY
jgi:hypothetical protein